MATSPNYGWLEPDNTDLVKNGALAIRTLGNAIDTTMATMTPKSIVDAKGDLIAASAADTPARLAVGNNGETLVADSSTSTGLSYQANWAAGKNKIINGDFYINQRSFSSTTTSDTYGFDRWYTTNSDGTVTSSAQTFTAGTAPVAGYEGANFLRQVTTGQTASTASARIVQGIENVRTFAGQTATLSFWAKANTGTPKIAIELSQNFGSGGSPSADVNTYAGQVTLSTSWARVSVTVAIPSISGKTVGTTANTSQLLLRMWTSAGSNFNARTGSLGIQSNTFDIWGVQLEAGSVATAFQTATGTIQGELSAAQRYYYRATSNSNNNQVYGTGFAASTTTILVPVFLPVQMRTTPTSLGYSNLRGSDETTDLTPSTVVANSRTNANILQLQLTVTGATAFRPYFAIGSGTAGYIEISAEL